MDDERRDAKEDRRDLQARRESMVRLILKEHRRDWETSSPYVRETTMMLVQKRSDMLDRCIALATERLPVVAEVLRGVSRQYEIVRVYYRQERGSRRNRGIGNRKKPGVPYTQDTSELVAKLMAVEDRISEANKGIKERASSGRHGEAAAAGGNPIKDIPSQQGEATPLEILDVLQWLKEQLGKPGIESDTLKKLAKQFVADFRS
jgi:hypothetical protein